ncbi:hypothetical protein K504DRAFT_464301 [Pleomassaria siparia CBS 279.74]|uniref:Uncharacterized protein n=1 Tax=Pleomassaria siparia CBS 279.74 TaxID=1314801 RepID=A0A6G1KIB3_9PLEO|nr:hypothetical protein K504DRAFT_464301 [Pleomassaria siparia CBS 279.74]
MDSQASLSQMSQMSHDSLMLSTELSRPATPNQGGSVNVVKTLSPDRYSFTSPAPPTTSSMTPPPSSQLPLLRTVARTPTPPTPQLSSPPPTSKLLNQPSILADSTAVLYKEEQISNASADELRSMVKELTGALRDIRISAAHGKLQYNMAVMESQESASRMAVELAMAQREIDVLQQAEEKRRNTMSSPVQSIQESPINPANAILMSEMNRQNQMLQSDNEELRDMLEQQKRLTEHREGELASVMEENDRLKTRIRKNRDHIAPFLPYLEQMNEQGSPRSIIATPHQATPRTRLHRVPPPLSNEGSRGQNNFEALLLADKMLSQETATAPSTPITRSHMPRSRFGHHRGAQSMSSLPLPQTPNRRSAALHPEVPHTPPIFSAVNVPQSAPPAHYQQKVAHVRRESSNSTITASSADDEEAFTDREEDDVPESQASQMATSMLRRAAPSKQMSAPSSQQSATLVQSKIFGQIKKPIGASRSGEFEKRRLPSIESYSSPTKRGRIEREVGLGIGGLLRD